MTSVIGTGLVAAFDAAGVLGFADVQVAQQLAFLGGASDPRIPLAIALAVRAVRAGSVCVDLATVRQAVFESDESAVDVSALDWPDLEGWLSTLRDCPLVSVGADGPPGRPLRLVGTLLYLDRYWRDEQLVRADVEIRRSTPMSGVDLDRDRVVGVLRSVFPRVEGPAALAPGEPDHQLAAAATTVATRLCVLQGGPGTGKTSTVARILVVLATLEPDLHIGLAAPTGKAAARMGEAVKDALAALEPTAPGAADPAVVARLGRLQATTVHGLLGWRRDSTTRFAHDRTRPLPYDLIVVDEMSMVSLSLMARLLEATRPDARLLLVGDPDQLASVEAGAVFSDIGALVRAQDQTLPASTATHRMLDDLIAPVDRPAVAKPGLVRLTHTWRFQGRIADLAMAIRDGDTGRVDALIDALGPEDNVSFTPVSRGPADQAYDSLRQRVEAWGTALEERAEAGDAHGALEVLDRHRLLCAHRRGPAGVATWNRIARAWLGRSGEEPMALGEPLLVTRRDKALQVYNGDVGAVVRTGAGRRLALADLHQRSVRFLAPVQLTGLVPMYASTIHKAQGSQFQEVSVILPDRGSALLTRELLYTAITRASQGVHLYGTRDALREAVSRRANRASGLADRQR
ncbi:exodeoxyribonuclease V subunit alpha [Raineyella fluvialis]|uniref:RecBCD enzyme subunit RecD n=1 Tax=Raineyella fluvialis TaxID=2662261 RepID=A0A5Q2FCA4_9ACTN|nr:exodeoxyribonuclease V subunit alpha [Raineyella fluvialis]QGF24419.1 exodeoxyribonuclease V subunit alpha [Raineyella fluvialis]